MSNTIPGLVPHQVWGKERQLDSGEGTRENLGWVEWRGLGYSLDSSPLFGKVPSPLTASVSYL